MRRHNFNLPEFTIEAELGAHFRSTVYGRKEVEINMESFKSQFRYLLYISINAFMM